LFGDNEKKCVTDDPGIQIEVAGAGFPVAVCHRRWQSGAEQAAGRVVAAPAAGTPAGTGAGSSSGKSAG